MNKIEEFRNKVKGSIGSYVYIAAKDRMIRIADYSDELLSDLEDYSTKIEEVRVFNTECEYKLFRTRDGFAIRERSDSKADFMTQLQFLDIDTSKPVANNIVYATGGGRYELPESVLVKNDLGKLGLIVKYYIRRDETADRACIFDWRCAGFGEIDHVC